MTAMAMSLCQWLGIDRVGSIGTVERMVKKRMVKKRGLVPVGNVVAEIIARRGLGRERSVVEKEKIWREIVGDEMATMTRCGEARGGRLEVVVANSILIQELGFKKKEMIADLNKNIPGWNIRDIRFRVGQT